MKRILLTFFTALLSVFTWAQDKATDINVDINNKGGDNWYAAPWVWIVGAAVFILLLVALTRRRRD